MNEDIGPILQRWPYGEEGNIRRIVGVDGAEKIQLRVLLEGLHGILQFDCDGRPDGKRPHGRAFALDHHEILLRRRAEAAPSEKFKLTNEQAGELFEESSLVYHRYVILLQLSDYPRVIRDTARNMRLFRFVHEHAEDPDDRDRLERWWPYIIRLHHMARIMMKMQEENYDAAMEIITEARRELDTLAPQDDDIFRNEMERSVKALEEMEKNIEERRPLSKMQMLERERDEAVRREDYERAARLRDQIDELRKHDPDPPDAGE